MADLNEINKKPQHEDEIFDAPKGIKLFLGDKDVAFLTSVGRELTESWLQESFLLYRIDLNKTKVHKIYGEAKFKVWREPVEIYGRINVEVEEPKFHTQGGMLKRGMGKMKASMYLDHLEEIGLVKQKDGQYIELDLKTGDFIMFKNQYYEIKDDGFAQIANQYSYGGDRRFSLTITAVEVDEDRFRAR